MTDKHRFASVWDAIEDTPEESAKMTVKHFHNTGRNEEDPIFRIENLAGY